MNKRILLIDDDLDDQVIFTDTVRELDPEVECISLSSGNEAMKSLPEISPTPSAIFLDLNMPGMHGFDFLKSIKNQSNLKEIPVVILTTSSLPEDMEKARELGALGFMVKAGRFDVLKDQIGKTLNKIFEFKSSFRLI